ncbi:YceI family protein [Noviherbaspirillum sp. ST9]|uniref:YceI family protein n=1 Tax=Noviherbaspirillum sp. ST9 TaxID=3401606 RepID=UPI003B58A12F
MKLHAILRNTTVLALAVALPVLAAQLKSDPAKSSVSAVFKQMNVPVEGKFKRFNAQIDYNSAKPETSKAAMEIDVASFDLGDAEFNKEAQKKDWFNGPQFPKATFVSSALKPAAGGKLDVSGKLTIKGKTSDVAFPLTVKQEGATQVFEGALPIKRLAFNIGEGEWKDTSMVADEVVIKFRVVATQ